MNVLEVQVPWWRKAWDDQPLNVILIIALVVRVLAAFFSKGYAFHDDHFDVIRVAQDWVDGIPHWVADSIPPNHSMFYAAINAVFIYIAEGLGITDPQLKMVFIRLIHAIYSLLIVYYGYKITLRLTKRPEDAIIASLMLSLLWFMPYLGVKNLVEMVCIPPLMAAFYRVIKSEVNYYDWLIAGLLIGLSFTFRYHVVIFAGGLGIVMLFRKQFVPAIIFSIGFLISAFVIIGIIDMIFWEYPFQSIISYFQFNTENAYNYSTGPFYRFFITVVGFTVIPVSLFLLVGYMKGWKVSKELVLAATLFFIIHSLFPNKQERFIIPFFPFYIILGVIGWNQFIGNTDRFKTLIRGSWWFFWGLNIFATLALAITYSKKDRIEPLSYLHKKGDVNSLILETPSKSMKQVPSYYLGKNVSNFTDDLFEEYTGKKAVIREDIYTKESYRIIFEKTALKSIDSLKQEMSLVDKKPNYVIFKRSKDLEKRKANVLSIFNDKKLVRQKEVTPSYFDKFLHLLNPRVHKEEVNYIYKIESI
ncbi:MAG: glycosyltransferase family 39 protein [Fulvivirga sp.]